MSDTSKYPLELLGGYKPEERRKEVIDKLHKLLKEIENDNIYAKVLEEHKKSTEVLRKKKTRNTEDDELFDTSLEGIERNVKKLQIRVDEYDNPKKHFTKDYRTLVGYCGRYQTALDKIDVKGNEELRQRRKACLKQLDTLVDILAFKSHEDGLICKSCEIQE